MKARRSGLHCLLSAVFETSLGAIATVSIGAAVHLAFTGGSPSVLLETADSALYQAKGLGRNHVECFLVHAIPKIHS